MKVFYIKLKLHPFLNCIKHLKNSKFTVKVANFISDERTIRAVVPQGSVLDPTLYILYTADIQTGKNVLTSTLRMTQP